MNSKLKFLAELSKKVDMSKEFKGGYQKDWIVYNKSFDKLFCITIVKDESDNYKLYEFVNIFDNKDKIFEAVNMGYMTMIEAAKNRESYEYVIADHSFDKKGIDIEYWNDLVSDDKFWAKDSPNADIDLKEFNSQIRKLVKESDIRFKNF